MSLKSKRQVRCTLCTTHRWLGNAKGRFKEKEEFKRKEMKKEIEKYKSKSKP